MTLADKSNSVQEAVEIVNTRPANNVEKGESGADKLFFPISHVNGSLIMAGHLLIGVKNISLCVIWLNNDRVYPISAGYWFQRMPTQQPTTSQSWQTHTRLQKCTGSPSLWIYGSIE